MPSRNTTDGEDRDHSSPDYVGDLPAALSALASALSLGHDTTERLRALRE